MASETVRIFVVDQETPTPGAIEDVLVRVFDSTGSTFITQNTTTLVGSDAIADFTLDGDDPPIEYQVRLSKVGVAFDGLLGDDSKTPQLIEVYSPPANAPSGTNDFIVKGQTFVRPTAADDKLCRVSGFFKRGDSLPYPNLDIIFIPLFNPTIVSGNAVMGGQIVARTDEDGYIEVDLYRGGTYSAIIETLEDNAMELVVPDSSSFNIVDLIFPVVKEVIFNPSSVNLAVGGTEEIVPTVTASNTVVLEGAAPADVEYVVDDESIATVLVMDDRLVITGVSAGTTQLSASRKDSSIVVVPDSGIVQTPLSVVVS